MFVFWGARSDLYRWFCPPIDPQVTCFLINTFVLQSFNLTPSSSNNLKFRQEISKKEKPLQKELQILNEPCCMCDRPDN